jgi:RNA ligase
VLLAAYRPADGTEELLSTVAPHWAPIGPVIRSWGLDDDVSKLEGLAAASITLGGDEVGGTEDEGYVIRYASGQRAKIKLASYLILHRLFTGTNERTIWEVLASDQDPAVLFDQVPDEFADWARQIAMRLASEHGQIVAEAHADFGEVIAQLPAVYDRKSFALLAKETKHRSALFLLVDGRHDAVAAWAWKQIKPRGDKPFKNDEDN